MVGVAMKMTIHYTKRFAQSLIAIINYWRNDLMISSDHIAKFTTHIDKKISLLSQFPEMGQDITSLYGFSQQTYRILIGHSYELFYRIDYRNKIILVGSIHGTSQMKIKF